MKKNMATYVASCLPIAMRAVMDSIELDNEGKPKEAYCSYLSSMLFIIKTLKDDAWDQEFGKVCNQDTIKLLKLVAQCHERAFDIISSFKQEGSSTTDLQNQGRTMSHSLTAPQTGNLDATNARDRGRSLDTGSYSLPAASDVSKAARTPSSSGATNIDKLILSLPTPPTRKGSFNSAASRSTNVSNIDGIQRNQMFQAYQRRKSSLQSNIQQRHKAEYNLGRFRRTVENMAIEKARRDALNRKLEERRERLRIKAEQRFADKTGSRATDAAYEKKIYAKILEFEQETTWPQTLRENLAAQPEDTELIEDIVKRVLGSKEHPLGQLMAEMQFALYRELSLLVSDFACPVYEQPPFKKRRAKESIDFVDVKNADISSSRSKLSNNDEGGEDCARTVDISEGDKESSKSIVEGFGATIRTSETTGISKKEVDSPEAEVAKAKESFKHVEMGEIAALRGEMSSPESSETIDQGTEVSKADKAEEEMADVAGLEVTGSISNRPSSVEDTVTETVDEPLDDSDKTVSGISIDSDADISKPDLPEKSKNWKEDVKNKSKGSIKIFSKDFDSEFHDFEEYMLENLDSDDFDLLPGESRVQTDSENVESEQGREKDDFEADDFEAGSNDKDQEKTVDTQELGDITILPESGVGDQTGNSMSLSEFSRDNEPLKEPSPEETCDLEDDILKDDTRVEDCAETGKTEDNERIKNDEECELEDVCEQNENEIDTENFSSFKLRDEESMDHVNKLDSERVISLDQEVQVAQVGETTECKDLGEGKESKDCQDDDLSIKGSDIVEQGFIPSVNKLEVVEKNDVIEDLINELVDRNKKYQTDAGLDLDEEILDDIFDDDISSDNGCSECVKENEGEGLDGELAGKIDKDNKQVIGNSEGSIGPELDLALIDSGGLPTDIRDSADRLNNKRTTELEEPNNGPLHSEGDNDVFNDHLIEQYSKCQHDSKDYAKMKKKVDSAVKEVHSSLDKLHSLLIVTYDELDLPIGRDQSYAVVETIFFKPLWQWLNLVFRRLNLKKELQMYQVIKKRWECGPLDFFVRERYALQETEAESAVYPYEAAVEELKKIVLYSSPLDKLECLVLTSKLICQCVTDYWTKRGDSSPPSVGCDDLLPILTYVIVKAALPQLVSECHAIEEFINESYLLGEEGYCLTTLSTAIAYVLNLRSGDMPGQALN